MKNGILAVCASVAFAAGAASAGQVYMGALGQTSLLSSSFTSAGMAGEGVDAANIQQIGVTGRTGNALNFGAPGSAGASVASFANTASTTGSFYLDAAAGLGSNWFDSGAGLNRPAGDTMTLAFGQTGGYTAKDITVGFAPGVQAFGFNFNDVGDQGGAFEVSFSDGTVQTIAFNGSGDADSSDMQSGYIALIASAGNEITSLRLTQPTGANDGVSIYGMSTLAVVPLPPAAWAGLAMLGGIAGVRKLRRRG